MLTTTQFLKKLKEKRGIELKYENFLNALRNKKIKSKKEMIGDRVSYLIEEKEIDNINIKTIII